MCACVCVCVCVLVYVSVCVHCIGYPIPVTKNICLTGNTRLFFLTYNSKYGDAAKEKCILQEMHVFC